MRSYLERLAATAISPGGSFHPLAGSLYAATADPRPPASSIEAEAHETHQPGPFASPAAQPPFFVQQTTLHAQQQATSFETATPAATTPPTFQATPPARVQPLSNPNHGQQPPPERVLRTEDFPRERTVQGEPSSIAASPLGLPLSGLSEPTGVLAANPQTGLSKTEAQYTDLPSRDDPPAKIIPAASYKVEVVDDRRAPSNQAKAVVPPMRAPDRSASTSTFSARESSPSPSLSEQVTAPPEAVTRPTSPTPFPSAPEPAPQSTLPDPPAYRPLVADYTPPSRPGALSLQPSPQRPRTPDLRDQPQTREPDEIQIHIGRIEVTAYQPAAAAAPQSPARRTPSLDSYLRRGAVRA